MEEKAKKSEKSIWPYRRNRYPFSIIENIEDDWDLQGCSSPFGVSLFEDDECVYVEAALPGIAPHEIDLSFEKGTLWIKADKKDEAEDNKKKFYKKARSTFSYRIPVPGDVDETRHPEAVCKNGVLRVTFCKKENHPTKKILVKGG